MRGAGHIETVSHLARLAEDPTSERTVGTGQPLRWTLNVMGGSVATIKVALLVTPAPDRLRHVWP